MTKNKLFNQEQYLIEMTELYSTFTMIVTYYSHGSKYKTPGKFCYNTLIRRSQKEKNSPLATAYSGGCKKMCEVSYIYLYGCSPLTYKFLL